IGRKRDNHFFQRDSSVLESFVKIIDEVIVVIGINEIDIFFGKNETGTDVQFGQHRIVWILYVKNVLADVIEVLSLLITKVRIRIAIADDFAGAFYTDRTMVGRNDDTYLLLRKPFQRVQQRRM